MLKQYYYKLKPKLSRKHFIIPILLVTFLILFQLTYEKMKDGTIADFNTEQQILAQTAAQGITSFFTNYQSDLGFFTKLDHIRDFNQQGEKLIESYYNNRKNLISGISRIDSNGIIQYTFPYDSSSIGKDISYQKHVDLIRLTHQPVISDVFTAVQGYATIALHFPIFNDKKYVGSIAILIPIDKLGERFLDKINIKGIGDAWILSEKLIEVYCPYQEHIGNTYLDNMANNHEAINFAETIRTRNSGTAKSIHSPKKENVTQHNEEKHIVYYRASLGNTYWTIVFSYQEEDIYTELNLLRNRLLIILTVLFFFILYFFYSNSKIRAILKEEGKRKNAEKTLRESEEKYRTMIETSNDFIWMLDHEGKISFLNDRAQEKTGLLRKEWYGKHFSPLVLAKELPFLHQVFIRSMNGESVNYEFNLKVGDDKAFTLLVNTAPIFTNNVVSGTISFAKDITEQKQLERAHKTILDISQIPDQTTTLYDFLEKIHLKVKSVLRVENFFMALYHKETSTYTFPYYHDEMDHYKPDEHFNIENGYTDLVRKKGKTILITEESKKEIRDKYHVKSYGDNMAIWLGIPIKMGNQNEVIGVIVIQDYHNLNAYSTSEIATFEIIVDNIGRYIERVKYLDEILKAKEKAEESDRLKSAFLANMSHEIRTPMNGILGFSELLKEPDLTGEEQKTYIGVIERAGHRMLNIINDIVDISKIESGQMEALIKNTNVNEQTEFIYNFFKSEVEKKGLKLSLNNTLPHTSVNIKTDTEKLYAILTNLVKNSIKYTQEGNIEFGYHLKENFLEFYVKDTGIGIPKNRQEAVFERFIQADIANKMAQDGAGLGLAISKAYVNMLGGEIWGNSETEESSGKSGSVFYFTIPYQVI